ncbi:unnamed protein product, partial [Discosporangium mesarthrocarpum]
SALETLPGILEVEVSRFQILNDGSLWAVTFKNPYGYYEKMSIDTSYLTGTGLGATVTRDTAGNSIGGSFRLYNGFNRSEPLAWNAEDADVAEAFEGLNKSYAYEGGVQASRSNMSETGSYAWTVTFPVTAGDVEEVQVDSTGLTGDGAIGQVFEVQTACFPEIQRVETSSSSAISGYFSLGVGGEWTPPIDHNATADTVLEALSGLHGLSNISVSRTGPTGLQTLTVQTFAWDVTFSGLTGPQPLLEACCGENVLLDNPNSTTATLESFYTGDAEVTVKRITPGLGAPLGGTWYLSVDGESTPNIAHNATDEDVARAIANLSTSGQFSVETKTPVQSGITSWILTFDDWNHPNNTIEKNVTVGYEGLTGTRSAANVDVAGGFCIKEVQRLTSIISSGTIDSCTIGSAAIPSFDFDANASTVTSVLGSVEVTILGDVWVERVNTTVSGGGVWDVTFLENAQDVPMLSCGSDATVTLVTGSTCEGIGGEFVLGFHGNLTAPIPFNASADQVKDALEALPAIDNVTVTGGSSNVTDPNGGREWYVTFSGRDVDGNVALISADGSELTGSGSTVDIVESSPGNEPGGHFMLESDTARRGWPEHRSGWIEVGMTASEVEEALLEMPGVKAVDVEVNGSLPTVGPYAWTVTFPHVKDGRRTGQSGNRKSMMVVNKHFTGDGTDAEATTLRDGGTVIGGLFQVSYNGSIQTVSAAASATSMQNVLVEGLGLPIGIHVDRHGPFADGGFTWTITLPEEVTLGDGYLVVDGSRLSGENPSVNVTLVQPASLPLGGNFTLELWGNTTVIQHNTTDVDMKLAIESLSWEGGNVSVTARPVGLDGGMEWVVTFASLAFVGNLPLLKVNGSGLSGTGSTVLVEETSAGVAADVQKITVAGYNGSFSIFSTSPAGQTNGTEESIRSSPVPWYATSNDMAKAVWQATGQWVYVERVAVRSMGEGYTWTILFAEALSGTWRRLHVNSSGLSPATSEASGREVSIASVHNSTVEAFGGTFSVGYGQKCDERASGIVCVPAAATSIPHNVSASSLAYMLESLPAIVIALVSSDGGITEYWQRTWSPDMAAVEWTGEVVTGGDLPLLEANASSLEGTLPGTYVTEIVKGTSSQAGAVVDVEVTQNGQDFTASGATFSYLPLVTVHTIIPSHGPAYGGTEVLVLGSNFRRSSRLACRFGPNAVDPRTTVPAARYLNTTALLCITPPFLPNSNPDGAGVVALEVTNNAGLGGHTSASSSFSQSGVLYRYEPPPKVEGVVPHLGPASGNFRVRVSGGPFPDTDELRCRFGSVVVFAERLSASEIQCYAPPHKEGVYPLEISLNDQDYTDVRFPFFFFTDQELFRIMPVLGPAEAAGTAVTLYGSGFVNSTLLACRFGQAPPVPGRYVSSEEILCETPPLHPDSGGLEWSPLSEQRQDILNPLTGSRLLFPEAHYYPLYLQKLTSVEVTCNGQDYTNSGVSFLYQADTFTEKVGLAETLDRGNVSLFISGGHFVNSSTLACRVGASNIAATFLSPSLALC